MHSLRDKIKKSPYIKKMADKGISFVLLDNPNSLEFKLDGKIVWTNTNGTYTVLEESGQVFDYDGFVQLAKHYIANYRRYTVFAPKSLKVGTYKEV